MSAGFILYYILVTLQSIVLFPCNFSPIRNTEFLKLIGLIQKNG